VCIVNVLLIRSVSRFSTKYQPDFSEVQSSQAHLWKPPSFFSAGIRARSKWPPNTECVTIFYKVSVQWGKILTSALLRTTEFCFSAGTCARSKWPPNTECVTTFYQISGQWGTILTSTLMKTTEFFLRQLLVRVVNVLLIQSVSRFPTKYQFSEVKSSQAHFWKPPSLSRQVLVRVVNDLLIRSVSRFSTKYQVSEVQSSQAHFWKPPSFFSAATRAHRKWPSKLWYTRTQACRSHIHTHMRVPGTNTVARASTFGVCHDFLQNISSVR